MSWLTHAGDRLWVPARASHIWEPTVTKLYMQVSGMWQMWTELFDSFKIQIPTEYKKIRKNKNIKSTTRQTEKKETKKIHQKKIKITHYTWIQHRWLASSGWRVEACTDEQVRQWYAYRWRKRKLAAIMIVRQRARHFITTFNDKNK